MAFVIFTFSACANAQKPLAEQVKEGDKITGTIIKIHDGDTYDLLLEDKSQIRIRMEGIDAPEGGMPYYRVAKDSLASMCFGENITAHINEKESGRNRFIAWTYTEDDRELSHEMVKAGLARHYKQFNTDEVLAALEIEARKNKLNMWSEKDPVPPWVIRKARWQGVKYKDLNVYRERTLDLKSDKNELMDRGVKIKLENGDGQSMLKVYKDDVHLLDIEDIRFERKPILHLADYNMDGNPDILISYANKEFDYYLYNPEEKTFERKPEWKLHIWKLNTTEKQILTYPEGTMYEGKARLYEIDENGTPVQIKVVEYK